MRLFVRYYYCIVITTLMMFGCRKDVDTAATISNENSFYSEESISKLLTANQFGVVINSSSSKPSGSDGTAPQLILSPSDKIRLAKTYGVTYIRSGITKDQWDTSKEGFLYTYDNFTKNGFKVVLNIIWKTNYKDENGTNVPIPFPTNANNPNSAYYKYVKAVMDALTAEGRTPPAAVVVENEEPNKIYHVVNTEADWTKYINMLQANIDICHSKNVKVTNGGLTVRLLTYAAHDWLKNGLMRPKTAKSFANASMPPSNYYTLYPPVPPGVNGVGKSYIESQVYMVNWFVNKYLTMNLDYVNFHWYEPANVRGWDDVKNNGTPWSYGISEDDTAANAMDNVINYLKTRTTKEVISNEIGQLTISPCLTTKILHKIKARPYNAFQITTWYDGDGDDTYEGKALHNTHSANLYSLRSTGVAFKKFIVSPTTASLICTP